MNTIAALIANAPHRPFFVYRPQSLKQAAKKFTQQLTPHSMFAVKTNPEPHILQALYDHGIRAFDVASLQEVEQLRDLLPDTQLFFMHPVKPRYAIREAYFTHGVRHFSLDCEEELNKILEETDYATDLHLHIRLSIPNNFAELTLADKFGINLQDAPELLQKTASHAEKLGLCFHVGSQCMHPDAYRIAIRMSGEVVKQAGVTLDYFNVGGGFPSLYPGMTPPPLDDYFHAIHEEFTRLDNSEQMTLLAEPGRALVAESTSLIVRVDLRKGNRLYLNDGTYGSLFDAGTPKFIFPMRLIRGEQPHSCDLMPFSFYGPTCDSLDFMPGPFYLPSDICEGDMIEIGQMGAYGRNMATKFNGFSHDETIIEVSDKPLMTLYEQQKIPNRRLEVIAA